MACVSRLRLYQQARAVTAASSPGRRYPSNRAPLPSPARCCPARRYRKLGHGCHIFAPLSALRRFFFSGAQHSPPGQKPCTAGRWTSLILLLGFYTRQPGKKNNTTPAPYLRRVSRKSSCRCRSHSAGSSHSTKSGIPTRIPHPYPLPLGRTMGSRRSCVSRCK